MLILKVWHANASGANLITVPKDSNIKAGDYVKIIKLEDTDELIKDMEK